MAQHHPEDFLKKIRRVGRAINLLATVSPALAGRAAFRLFCTPRRLLIRADDRAFLDTAEQQTLVLENLPIRIYTWPALATENPRTVLFLHGWESHSARWRKFVAPLRRAGFTVLAFDAPGHGLSGGRVINLPLYSRVLTDFMVRCGVPDALVGHSLGGAAVVMSMGAFGAPRVRQAVVMGAFAETTRVMQDFGNFMALTPVVLHQVGQEIWRRSGIAVEAYSVRGKAALLTDVQGFVLHDRDDEVAPAAEGRAIAEAWGARYLETQGLGHRMQGQAVVRAVVDFLRDAGDQSARESR